MSKKEKKIYDFTRLEVEVEFDNYRAVDVSKIVSNVIHQGTDDIGVDDKAREIYHSGCAEIPEEGMRRRMAAIVMHSTLVAPVKSAVRKLLEG